MLAAPTHTLPKGPATSYYKGDVFYIDLDTLPSLIQTQITLFANTGICHTTIVHTNGSMSTDPEIVSRFCHRDNKVLHVFISVFEDVCKNSNAAASSLPCLVCQQLRLHHVLSANRLACFWDKEGEQWCSSATNMLQIPHVALPVCSKFSGQQPPFRRSLLLRYMSETTRQRSATQCGWIQQE